jgi:Ser/Thr protein kinase RdoA (MazF antagonist)
MTVTDSADHPTARARALAKAGDYDGAGRVIAELVREAFGLAATTATINRDQYSLNSLNGIVAIGDGSEYFFKFHQEEGEGDTVAEYYRAETLREAGYPVDVPAFASREVGRQILLYRRRRDRRFADLCRAAELDGTIGTAPLVRAQRALDCIIGERYLATLHSATGDEAAAEPVHRLFHARLVDPDAPERLGGRAARFYLDQPFQFPGLNTHWRDIGHRRWRINAVEYQGSLAGLFEESRQRLAPTNFAGAAVVAHGDAHNANVWCEAAESAAPRLVFFDPAFAGSHVPALLAEIKATFHNIFAHPFWLYDAQLAAEKYRAAIRLRGEVLEVEHDWRLSDLRTAFLDSKFRQVWRPLLTELKSRGMLPANWRRIIRCALFCCPTLVMNLRAGAGDHNPVSSAIGLSVAIMAGSEPANGRDSLSAMLDDLEPR